MKGKGRGGLHCRRLLKQKRGGKVEKKKIIKKPLPHDLHAPGFSLQPRPTQGASHRLPAAPVPVGLPDLLPTGVTGMRQGTVHIWKTPTPPLERQIVSAHRISTLL